jgi:hypothetical protein
LFRLILFYSITIFLWHFVHLFYEALLWQAFLRLGYLVSDLPLGLPELDLQNRLYCAIGTIMYVPNADWYTVGTTTVLPLLLSSSGISAIARTRMIFFGLAMLFMFQLVCAFLDVYALLYSDSPIQLNNETARVYKVLAYRETDAKTVIWLVHFFKVFVRHVVTLAVWAGLICWVKRRQAGLLFERLL